MRVRTLVSLGLATLLALSACAADRSTEIAAPPSGSSSGMPLAPQGTAGTPGTAEPESTPLPPTPESTQPAPGSSAAPLTPSQAGGVVKTCLGKVPLNRPVATGTGPGGSLMVTGSAGVALTFDDGPDPINTPKILDLLRECGVKATFCLVGFRARDRPDLVRRIYNEGHTLCNHSWQHLLDLRKHTDAYILHDLSKTNDEIRKIVPGAPIAYFRAPGGNFTTHLVALAGSLGMKSIYWKVDPRDWDAATYGHGSAMVKHITGVIQSQTRPGAIILSHDNGKPDTITAYRALLPWLKARFTLIALPTGTP